jgi:hypothetical protein
MEEMRSLLPLESFSEIPATPNLILFGTMHRFLNWTTIDFMNIALAFLLGFSNTETVLQAALDGKVGSQPPLLIGSLLRVFGFKVFYWVAGWNTETQSGGLYGDNYSNDGGGWSILN